MVSDTEKIMKKMWQLQEAKKEHFYLLLGLTFVITSLYGILLAYKWAGGIELVTMDFVGGTSMFLMTVLIFKMTFDHKHNADEIHNTYMEMVSSAAKRKKK